MPTSTTLRVLNMLVRTFQADSSVHTKLKEKKFCGATVSCLTNAWGECIYNYAATRLATNVFVSCICARVAGNLDSCIVCYVLFPETLRKTDWAGKGGLYQGVFATWPPITPCFKPQCLGLGTSSFQIADLVFSSGIACFCS